MSDIERARDFVTTLSAHDPSTLEDARFWLRESLAWVTKLTDALEQAEERAARAERLLENFSKKIAEAREEGGRQR